MIDPAAPEPRWHLPAPFGVPTAHDFPDCVACQMWEDAEASWPRPCRLHYGGEPDDPSKEWSHE